MQRGRIHARTVQLQCEVGKQYGVPEEDLEALGFDLDALADPEGSVAREPAYLHLVKVHERADFESFTIELARIHSISATGPVGMAAKLTPSLRDGMDCYLRYQHLVNGLATVEVTTVDGVAIWTEHRPGERTLGSMLATEISVVISVTILRSLVPDLLPKAIEMPRPDANAARYGDFCGAPVRPGSDRGRFTFDAQWLDTKNPEADPEMAAYFTHLLEKANARAQAAPSVVMDVRRAVMEKLVQGPPALSEVAKHLAMSPRSLQRKLQEESVTYAEVMDGIRRDLALAHLENPQLTAGEVGYLVGYADTRSFHRAFRRWTGTSPQAFRQQRSAG